VSQVLGSQRLVLRSRMRHKATPADQVGDFFGMDRRIILLLFFLISRVPTPRRPRECLSMLIMPTVPDKLVLLPISCWRQHCPKRLMILAF
jgi:hypothetical protein